MNNKYNDLFDELVKSYYDGNFDETLSKIMVCHEKSPQETFKIITSLCGVDIKFDNNYLHNLKKAITQYSINKRIVEKLECCSTPCTKNKDDKYASSELLEELINIKKSPKKKINGFTFLPLK